MNIRHKRRGLSTTHIVLIVLAIVGLVILLVCAGLAALTFPAVAKAREQATMLKAGTQLRQIEMARSVYAQTFRDPEQRLSQITIQMLLDEQFITAELVQSPYGPVSDGRGDFWLNPRPTVNEPRNATPDDRMIAAYDRAMYETRDRVNVAYYTGEVVLMTRTEFERKMTLPANSEVDFDLPTPRR